MGGIANNPNDPNNPFFGTDADPRYPRPGPITSQVPSYLQPYVQNMFNNPQQPRKPGNPFLNMQPSAGYFSPANQDAINQDIQNAQNGIFLGPGGQGGGIFGGPTQLTPTMAPKPMPIPGRPIIDPVRPGYGQRPQRGPAPRDITPSTLQQGLGGLGGLNKIGGMM